MPAFNFLSIAKKISVKSSRFPLIKVSGPSPSLRMNPSLSPKLNPSPSPSLNRDPGLDPA